jgi:hypothetical protein
VTTTELAPPVTAWWQGVGSPGIAGYFLADLVAVGAMAVALPLSGDFSGGLGEYLSGVVVVGVFAFIYSVPLAAVGIPIVHVSCLRVRSQAVHVLAAGLVGVAAAMVPLALTGGGLDIVPGLYLGAATAIGRAVVIPMARSRRQ